MRRLTYLRVRAQNIDETTYLPVTVHFAFLQARELVHINAVDTNTGLIREIVGVEIGSGNRLAKTRGDDSLRVEKLHSILRFKRSNLPGVLADREIREHSEVFGEFLCVGNGMLGVWSRKVAIMERGGIICPHKRLISEITRVGGDGHQQRPLASFMVVIAVVRSPGRTSVRA